MKWFCIAVERMLCHLFGCSFLSSTRPAFFFFFLPLLEYMVNQVLGDHVCMSALLCDDCPREGLWREEDFSNPVTYRKGTDHTGIHTSFI